MSLIDNASPWNDTSGAPIDCHEGMILRVDDIWYWYGRRYRGNDEGVYGTAGGPFRCPIVVSTSTDLVNWTSTRVAVEYPTDPRWSTGTLHRPRVAFNARTGLYTLWFFHLVTEPKAAVVTLVATSPTPGAPFEIVGQANTIGTVPSGDLDLFIDNDGRSYLASGDWDRNALIAPMTDDFLGTTEAPTVVLAANAASKLRYEGYALTRHRGRYLYAASGVNGLAPSETAYALADHPLGPWTIMGTMSRESTWGCQISSLAHIAETGVLVALCDRWLHDYAGRPTTEALYSAQQWYPVSFDVRTGRARMLPLKQWDPTLPIEELERQDAELVS